MLDSTQLVTKYGNPDINSHIFELAWLVMYDIPNDVAQYFPHLPRRIYLNKDIAGPFESVLRALISNGCYTEIKTYEGCWNIRNQRGSDKISTHAFGLSFDMNSAWNPFIIRKKETDAQWENIRHANVKWSEKFLQTWRDKHWICGADWMHRLDGMHFEFTNELYNIINLPL